MAVLTINGYKVSPQTMEYQRTDVDATGSGRDQTGMLYRDRVAIKRKLVCTFKPMTTDEIKPLLQAVSPMFFNVTYPDPYSGTFETMNCYVGDRTAPLYYHDEETKKDLWKGLNMNFIER